MGDGITGPFNGLCSATGGALCVDGIPDWLQAALIFGLALLLSVALLIALLIEIQLANARARSAVAGLILGHKNPNLVGLHAGFFMCGFGSLLVGVVAGGTSMLYGVQYGPPGFVVGGVVVTLVTLLILLGRFGTNGWAFPPSVCVAVGLSLAYLGVNAAQEGISIAGLVVLVIGIIWGGTNRNRHFSH